MVLGVPRWKLNIYSFVMTVASLTVGDHKPSRKSGRNLVNILVKSICQGGNLVNILVKSLCQGGNLVNILVKSLCQGGNMVNILAKSLCQGGNMVNMLAKSRDYVRNQAAKEEID